MMANYAALFMSEITDSTRRLAEIKRKRLELERDEMMLRSRLACTRVCARMCNKCFGWYDPAVGCKCEVDREL